MTGESHESGRRGLRRTANAFEGNEPPSGDRAGQSGMDVSGITAQPGRHGDGHIYTVVLAGNPNAGKTTIFNSLTGARHHVGNYPGVTVERKEGLIRHSGMRLRIVDLPGTYSLTAHSLEERVARDFLIEEKPDVVVQVVDASCLERNLFLAIQLLELEQNLVICLNMMDVAEQRGMSIDVDRLSSLLGVPIVTTVGSEQLGMDRLLDSVVQAVCRPAGEVSPRIRYDRELGDFIDELTTLLGEGCESQEDVPPLGWLAVKLLEQDVLVREYVEENFSNHQEVLAAAVRACETLEKLYGDPSDIIIADRRYGFISGACQESVRLTVEERHRFSDRIDDIVAHRVLGIPIFLAVIYLIFWMTFTLGELPMQLIEQAVHWSGHHLSMMWPKSSDSMIRSLLVDGILGGVGGVLVFLPNIVILFAGIAFLEDTGYIARAAFLTDWMMHRIGLHGRSFIPMIVGFGCTVPGILATRTLESTRDRLTTMLILPLISCSARFPIYTLIIPAFFPPAWHAPMLWGIYVFGIVLAILLARLLRSTILSGETTPFVMELPVYRLPTLRGVLIHMWDRARLYAAKAGTVILAASVLLWFIQTYPADPEAARQESASLAAAEAAYARAIAGLGKGRLDEAEAGLLRRALTARHCLEVAADRYYPHEEGYRKAEDEYARLRREFERSKLLSTFDGLVAALRESRLRKTCLQTRALPGVYDVSPVVMDLTRRFPRLCPVALEYLDGIERPYRLAVDRARRIRAARKLDHSIAGRIGLALEPILRPLGFDRRVATALIGAFAAKEIFVAQMGIVASVDMAGDDLESLRVWLQRRYRPLVGLTLMLFCLIATPCVATIAATRQESGSWKWALLQLGGLTTLAYIICLAVYQVGCLLGY